MAAEASSASNELQAEAFKQLYPEQYYAKFINSSLRPDGRPLDGARATTIGLNPIGTADSSALVKIGETTAMAGIKLGVRSKLLSAWLAVTGPDSQAALDASVLVSRVSNFKQADNVMLTLLAMPAQISALEEEPALESLLAVGVEMAAFSSSDARPGRPSPAAQCAQQQVHVKGTSRVKHS